MCNVHDALGTWKEHSLFVQNYEILSVCVHKTLSCSDISDIKV